MKKNFTALIIIIIGLALFIFWGQQIYPTTREGKLNFIASPSNQGVGGIVHLTLTSEFGGWCGTNLRSPYMEAELDLPDGLQLVKGNKKEVFPRIQVLPGKKRKSEVSWEVKVLKSGEYNLVASVAGNYDNRIKVNREDRQVSCGIVVKNTPYISIPELNKKVPEPYSDVEVITRINGEFPIDKAILLYSIEPSGIKADIQMKRQVDNDYYTAIIPKQDHNSIVNYRIDVLDVRGNHLESSQFDYKVLDSKKVNELPQLLIWLSAILSAIFILVYLFYRKQVIKKIFINPKIGAAPMDMNLVNAEIVKESHNENNLEQKRLIRNRYLVAYLVIGLLSLLIGIFTNQFGDVLKQF